MGLDEDIIVRTVELIKNKYSVDESIAFKYAEMALNVLESQIRTDFSRVINVVDVVVRN